MEWMDIGGEITLASCMYSVVIYVFGCAGRMQAGDASGTGVFDARHRTWDPTAMAAVDPTLASLLPPLIGPSDVSAS
jgi:hypothetical protein